MITDFVLETQTCQAVRFQIGRDHVALVDTPGFDDTKRSDAEILDEIVQYLVAQYELGIKLRGIIYMHRITDNKMQGTAQRYFEIFQRLVGDQNLGNVVLLTTMWNQLKDEGVGLQRDQQLREEFWNVMEQKGSHIRSYKGSKQQAEAIICRLMRKEAVVLDIQRELVDERMSIEQTTAGKLVLPKLEEDIKKTDNQIMEFDRRIAKATDMREMKEVEELQNSRAAAFRQRQLDLQRRERLRTRPGLEVSQKIDQKKKLGKWKDRASMFASLMGLVISVTVNVILPLAGVAF